jgi:hypothetical protein
MIRERIAEPSSQNIGRDLSLARFARTCRAFLTVRRMVSLVVLLAAIAMPVVALAGDSTGAATGGA